MPKSAAQSDVWRAAILVVLAVCAPRVLDSLASDYAMSQRRRSPVIAADWRCGARHVVLTLHGSGRRASDQPDPPGTGRAEAA